MKSIKSALFVAIATAAAFTPSDANASFVSLEELTFPAGQDFDNDWTSTGNSFTSGGATFNNSFTDFGDFSVWAGFSLSRVSNISTPGFMNQYAAFAPLGAQGSGASGSAKYAVGFDNPYQPSPVAPLINLPAGEIPLSIAVANTTYAALSMQLGDDFAKKFGGPTGNDPDFFKLTISGLNDSNVKIGSVEFYLADFRFVDNQLDYIVSNWTQVDLSTLPAETRKLRFEFLSSDGGSGSTMNTPAYVAVDNLQTVPEPTAVGLLALASLGLATRRKRA